MKMSNYFLANESKRLILEAYRKNEITDEDYAEILRWLIANYSAEMYAITKTL